MRNLRYLGDSLYCIAEISYVYFNLPVTCEKLVFLPGLLLKQTVGLYCKCLFIVVV